MKLMHSSIFPRLYAILSYEVGWNRNLLSSACLVFVLDRGARSLQLHSATYIEGFGVELKLLASLLINRVIDQEQVNDLIFFVNPLLLRTNLLICFKGLSFLFVASKPVVWFGDCLRCKNLLHVLEYMIHQRISSHIWCTSDSLLSLRFSGEHIRIDRTLRLVSSLSCPNSWLSGIGPSKGNFGCCCLACRGRFLLFFS